ARRLAQARNHQDRRDRRPRRLLAAFDQAVLAETIESQGAPQPPAQPHVAKTTGALQTNLVQPHRNRLAPLSRRRLKQLVLLFPPRDPRSPSAGPRPSLLVKLRHRLLHHSAAAAHRAHQTPVTVRLAVLANRRVSQIHRRESSSQIHTDFLASTTRGGWHYKSVSQAAQSISSATAPVRPRPPAATSAKIAQKNSCAHKLRKLG